MPVTFELLPASRHDLTAAPELTVGLPREAQAYGDKAFSRARDEARSLAETGVALVPIRQANMRPNTWLEKVALREPRKRLEPVNSQLVAMGVQRLRAHSNAGFERKVHASLLALASANAAQQSG